MDALVDFLIDWGYLGMLVSAFLAGSVLPFSSEAVMVGLMAAGLHPVPLLIYGTIGNVAGSMFNYCIGCLGRMDWIERYLHVSSKDLHRAERFMAGRGAWIGFFSFIPVLGDALTVMMGLMRSNILISFVSVSIGKLLRYVIIVYGASFVF